MVTQDDLRGELAYISWFSPWCQVCSLEVPDIQQAIVDPLEGQPVQVYLASSDNESDVTRFLKDKGVTIRALLDPHGELMRTYDLSEATEQAAPYPIHVVVDADGIVRMLSVKSGLSEILTTIEELLAEGDG